MPQLGISAELIKIQPSMTKNEFDELIDDLNNDKNNTCTMVQLPFHS